MGCHSILFDGWNQGVLGNAGIFVNNGCQNLLDGSGSFRRDGHVAMFETVNGFVAGASGREKDNSWREVFVPENVNEVDWVYSGRHESRKSLPRSGRKYKDRLLKYEHIF
jgi:hypothetical protein